MKRHEATDFTPDATLFFFFFLERAWLVGSGGPAGGTIVHTEGEGGWCRGWGVVVRDVSCNVTKGGKACGQQKKNVSENARQRHHFVCEWAKSSSEQFLLQQWVRYPPPPLSLYLSHTNSPTGALVTSFPVDMNWLIMWQAECAIKTILQMSRSKCVFFFLCRWFDLLFLKMSSLSFLSFPGGPRAVVQLRPEVLLCGQIQGHRSVQLPRHRDRVRSSEMIVAHNLYADIKLLVVTYTIWVICI